MSRLALRDELRQELHKAQELARLSYGTGLKRMAIVFGLDLIQLSINLSLMDQTIQKSLESLQTADVVNALPQVEESVLLSFERHKLANNLRTWYFTELSATERREIEKYVGGGQ